MVFRKALEQNSYSSLRRVKDCFHNDFIMLTLQCEFQLIKVYLNELQAEEQMPPQLSNSRLLELKKALRDQPKSA